MFEGVGERGGGALLHSCWGHLMVQSPNPDRVSFSCSVFRRWDGTGSQMKGDRREEQGGRQKDRSCGAIQTVYSSNFSLINRLIERVHRSQVTGSSLAGGNWFFSNIYTQSQPK